ncbi:MAG TPA: mechanosensitive ion channel domain-containing protein [Gammaproteobacteria bacterium]|nr:mechanosensitive ion channel domain-containing protein [Gammaproteobacteria bacterium]
MQMIEDWLKLIRSVLDTPLISIGKVPLTPAKLLLAILILLIAFWVARLIERLIVGLSRSGHTTLSASGTYALSRILRYAVYVLGAVFAIQVLGIDMASLALFGGAVGIGIGLGLQSIFSNFVSGIIILLEKTLKVGDFVELQSGVLGRVSEINVRYTRITTTDSVDIVVPNSEFINGKLTNWTLKETHRRIHIPFGVAYGSDKSKVREAGLSAARAIKGTIMEAGREPEVWLVGFGDSSLNFELVVWVGQEMVVSPQRTQATYMWALEDALNERGLVIPFPQRDLHIKSGSLTLAQAPNENAKT